MFFRFFPTKEPCHLKMNSLTKLDITKAIPNKENTKFHYTLALAQCKRM